MAFKPMAPHERASIEAQVCLKGGVELACAEIANNPDGVAVTSAVENAMVLANALSDLKTTLAGTEIAIAPSNGDMDAAIAKSSAVISEAFEGTTQVNTTSSGVSQYVDDADYAEIHKLFLAESASGVKYGSKDSMFLDNSDIRQMFQDGVRNYPDDYWAEKLRGQPIKQTKNGKCALGDFKIKKGVNIGTDGKPVLGTGDGNHPLANKSGYFAGLVNHSPFNWADKENLFA